MGSMNVVHVYKNNDNLVFLNYDDDNLFESVDILNRNGYEHTMSLNPASFIKYTYDLIQEYKMQPTNLRNAIETLELLSRLFKDELRFPQRVKNQEL